MKLTRVHKLIYATFCGATVLVVVVFSFMGYDSYQEYKMFQAQEARLKERLEQAQHEYRQRQSYVSRFFTDNQFFQWVVRKKLGYASPDEVIIRFDEEDILAEKP